MKFFVRQIIQNKKAIAFNLHGKMSIPRPKTYYLLGFSETLGYILQTVVIMNNLLAIKTVLKPWLKMSLISSVTLAILCS